MDSHRVCQVNICPMYKRKDDLTPCFIGRSSPSIVSVREANEKPAQVNKPCDADPLRHRA